MNYNPEQLEAIAAREGYWRCLATAGSGKTTVLTERVKALIQESSENDVLALTFTTEAASNMQTRIGIKISKDSRAGFRTFHSLGLRLIRSEHMHLPFGLSNDPFPDPKILAGMLGAAMKQYGFSKKDFKEIRSYISNQKRKRITPEMELDNLGPFGDERRASVYSVYEKRLREGGMLDYDSMICEAVNLLENNKNVRERWQLKWLLADEAQDTDDLQFRMLQLLSEKHKNIFVVGDVNQALYSFRGAHPENLLDFEKWFPGAKTIVLPENFRSTPEIVEFSRRSAPIKDALMSGMRTANKSGEPVVFKEYENVLQESMSIISSALRNPGECAVLARTNAALADYEDLCVEHKVKFRLLGKSGFWHQSEVKNLTSLVGFVLSARPATKYAEELLTPQRGRIRSLTPEAAITAIVKAANLESMYASEEYAAEDNYALGNLRKASQIAARFDTLSAFSNQARKALHAPRKSKGALTIGTVHAAKGLEWPNVFVVGCQEGMMPHKNSSDLDEEQRIYYVAITRAALKLQISFVGLPSRFVKAELPPNMQASVPVPIVAQTEMFS